MPQYDERRTFDEDTLGTGCFSTSDWSVKRRGFLRMLIATAGLAVLEPLVARGEGSAHGTSTDGKLRAQLLTDDAFWSEVRGMFELDPTKIFMNIGTAGSMPREVVKFFNVENQAYVRESGNGYGNFFEQRKQIAPGFGVDPDELVLSYNTTAGLCAAILGIAWRKSDVVVTTNHEHAGGNAPLQIAADRYGIQVSRVALPWATTRRLQTMSRCLTTESGS